MTDIMCHYSAALHICPTSLVYVRACVDSAGRGQCLEETPSDEDFIYPDQMPGQIHNGDDQCRFEYGSQSMQCRKEVEGALVVLLQ